MRQISSPVCSGCLIFMVTCRLIVHEVPCPFSLAPPQGSVQISSPTWHSQIEGSVHSFKCPWYFQTSLLQWNHGLPFTDIQVSQEGCNRDLTGHRLPMSCPQAPVSTTEELMPCDQFCQQTVSRSDACYLWDKEEKYQWYSLCSFSPGCCHLGRHLLKDVRLPDKIQGSHWNLNFRWTVKFLCKHVSNIAWDMLIL